MAASSVVVADDFNPNLPREGEVGYFTVQPFSTAPQRFCVGVGTPDPARCANGDGPGVFVMTSDELLQFKCLGATKISEEIAIGDDSHKIRPVIIRFKMPAQGCPHGS